LGFSGFDADQVFLFEPPKHLGEQEWVSTGSVGHLQHIKSRLGMEKACCDFAYGFRFERTKGNLLNTNPIKRNF
jgi:hypothetical protein